MEQWPAVAWKFCYNTLSIPMDTTIVNTRVRTRVRTRVCTRTRVHDLPVEYTVEVYGINHCNIAIPVPVGAIPPCAIQDTGIPDTGTRVPVPVLQYYCIFYSTGMVPIDQ